LARLEGPPTDTDYDFKGTGSLKLVVPRPGNWYFSVKAETAGNCALVVDVVPCDVGTIGPTCNTKFDDAETLPYLMGIKEDAQKFKYWRVIVNSTHPLRASVRTDDGAFLDNVMIIASRGQLPTPSSADLINCTFQYCDGARILFLNASSSTQNETWFVGTTSSRTNLSYGVWFDSPCAQQCEAEHTGTCQVAYPDYGVCVCATSSLSGVACTNQNGIGPEYIVLIIIAALVIASAVIGFVAWAYMRRKRVAYDVVG